MYNVQGVYPKTEKLEQFVSFFSKNKQRSCTSCTYTYIPGVQVRTRTKNFRKVRDGEVRINYVTYY